MIDYIKKISKKINTENMIDILSIVLGNILITSAYAIITVPNKIINGGVTSFSLIIESFIGIDIGILVNFITVTLLMVCLIFLGKEYFLKSIISSLCYMVFFNVFHGLNVSIDINVYLEVLISAIMVGVGYYLCIAAKSSTVGFDIIALILHHKNNNINIAVAMRYINICIILLGIFNYGIYSIILGVLFTFIQSATLKRLLVKDDIKKQKILELGQEN
ncbi:YitT family protein [Clostridium sp.]|uniref:YitT family protein n=1 Tax=Clostridium sp. TaxID=1506 RepID=UPI003F332032